MSSKPPRPQSSKAFLTNQQSHSVSDSFRELLELLLEQIGRRRKVISLPINVAMALASILELMPNPPLTRDQVRSLRSDSVVNRSIGTLADLGITATPLEVIMPRYAAFHR